MTREVATDEITAKEPIPRGWVMAPWKEAETSEHADPKAFVLDELRSYASDIARYSVPIHSNEVQIIDIDTQEGIAETLATIRIDDPTLEEIATLPSDLSKASEDQIAQASAVAAAKALAFSDNMPLSDEEKNKVDRFIDRVVDAVANTVSRVGGKKGRAATAALALVATACGSVGTPTNSPNVTPTPIGVVVTTEGPTTTNPTSEPTTTSLSEPTQIIEETPPPVTETQPSGLNAINAGGVLPTLGGAEGVIYQPPTKLEVSEETLDDLISQGYTVNLAPGDFSGQKVCSEENPNDCYVVLALPPSLFYKGKLYNLSGEGSQSGSVEYKADDGSSAWWINWRHEPFKEYKLVSGFKSGVPVDITIDPDGQIASKEANAIFETPATSVDIKKGVIEIAGQKLTFAKTEAEKQQEVLSHLQRDLTAEEKTSLGLQGYAFESSASVNGMQSTVIVATDKLLENQLGSVLNADGIKLNVALGDSDQPLNSAERLNRAILTGHYLGFLEDNNLDGKSYPFDQYITDLASGQDRTYKLRGDGETLTVNPKETTEVIFIYDTWASYGRTSIMLYPHLHVGYKRTNTGGLRLLVTLPNPVIEAQISSRKDKLQYESSMATNGLLLSLRTLGWPEEKQHTLHYTEVERLLKFHQSEITNELQSLYGVQSDASYNGYLSFLTITQSP